MRATHERAPRALREAIEEEANYRYCALDAPTITDAEYDRLVRELEDLEAGYPELATSDSPTRRVGMAPLASFATVQHRMPMLSINNASTDDEVEAFGRRVREAWGVERVEYNGEPKFDGLAISLACERGAPTQGATRGDGVAGEDVTANLRTPGGKLAKAEALGIPVLDGNGLLKLLKG